MKQLVLAFHVACRFSSSMDEDGESEPTQPQAYRIVTSDVFNHVMIQGLSKFPSLFNSLFQIADNEDDASTSEDANKQKKKKAPHIQHQLTSHSRWKRMKTAIKSYLVNVQFFLEQTSEPKMTTFVLKQLEASGVIQYYTAFPVLAKKILKV